jgi:hypothetical protein
MNVSLNVSESAVCPGTVVKVIPAPGLPAGAAMEWSVNGQPVSHDPTFDFATANQPAGPYRIGLRVTKAGYNDGTAETTVTVKDYQPPSGTLTASPAEIWVGEKSTLTPNFTAGQCGGPLQPAQFTASEGTITGSEFDSSSVTFDPSDNSEQRKTITVTAKVSDGKGIGSADTQIVVKKKASIVAKRFPDIVFAENSARVNNCGKRLLLEELNSQTDADPTGSVYFIGHQAPSEKAPGLDLKRAQNAAAVISAGKGICTAFPTSQIFVSGDGTNQTADFQPYFCGTSTGVTERRGQAVRQNDDQAKLRRVEVWFVPTNGKPPETARNPQTAASAGVPALGCPR